MNDGCCVLRTVALCALHFMLHCSAAALECPARLRPDQDNVIVVLDASGSMRTKMKKAMNKTRMEAAKEALLAVTAGRCRQTTNVGVLVFSSSNVKNDWVYPLKPVNRAGVGQGHQLAAAWRRHAAGGVSEEGDRCPAQAAPRAARLRHVSAAGGDRRAGERSGTGRHVPAGRAVARHHAST